MATARDVKTVGIAVRDALQAKINSGDYAPNDRDRMMSAHTVFTRRLSAFAANPADGEASPTYDAALLAEHNASAAIANCSPHDASSIDAALAAVGIAGKALVAITAPSFANALAVRRPPRGGDERLVTAVAADGPAPPPTPNTEPYLTSLAKLFPAEALSALLLVLAIDQDRFAVQRNVLIGIIALASAVLRYLSSRDPDTGKPDKLAVFVSVISFLIYAAALNAFGPLFGTDEPTTRIIATVAAILWMAILTQVVRKAPAP